MALPLANPPLQRIDHATLTRTQHRHTLRFLRLWHLASVDAPTVAVAWALGFAWVAGAQIEAWLLALLACGTWIVYVGDRMLDAHRAIVAGTLSELRERHIFHWRHRHKLVPLAFGCAAISGILVLRLMPVVARQGNFALAAAALVYFSGVHSPARLPEWVRRVVSKEFLVGVLFTSGCAAPTLSKVGSKEMPLLVCVSFFAVLAWANCSAIEVWESAEPRKSLVLRNGILSFAGIVVAIAMAWVDPHASALLCAGATSAALMALLDREKERMTPLALRALADCVLLTPMVLIAFGAYAR